MQKSAQGAELSEIRGEVSYPKRAEILSKLLLINHYRRKINVKKDRPERRQKGHFVIWENIDNAKRKAARKAQKMAAAPTD